MANDSYSIAVPNIENTDIVVALAGNPNVGKSTVFNALTGLKQHTGNWPGKTITNAVGGYTHNSRRFDIVDVPGTYSLMANSPDEEAARDFICFGEPDVVIAVLDATCLERNLNLALQILEVTRKVVVCINLLDEAKKKKISVDLDELSLQLGVPVVGTSARSGIGLEDLKQAVFDVAVGNKKTFHVKTIYPEEIESASAVIEKSLEKTDTKSLDKRWLSLKLLDADSKLQKAIECYLGHDILQNQNVLLAVEKANKNLKHSGIKKKYIRDKIVESIVQKSERIYSYSVTVSDKGYTARDRKLDKLLTSRLTGIPIMILLFALIFYITIVGANYPSDLLSMLFGKIQEWLYMFFDLINAPAFVTGLIVDGIYKTLSWVVAVMLPPMAIFFPLFTLLEDFGYLPRVAFNMDKFFKKANAHGKQALTMMMGFGCNACGVTGCRIIESPRERMIATVTNNFVPCNGRFPTLIAIITMFFAVGIAAPLQSLASAAMLIAVVVFGVVVTLLVSKALSATVLKGMPSSFSLELPPYRRPQIGKTIVRSLCDRTIFVLGRAVSVAAPAGLIIWLLANININNASLLSYCTGFLEPLGSLMGLDGVILMAFILGFPANEIVIPIIIMSYMATGSITDYDSLSQLHTLLIDNGWTWVTALCTMMFSLLHFPCSTTCITIYKETKSLRWTLFSFVLPTVLGMAVCMLINLTALAFGL